MARVFRSWTRLLALAAAVLVVLSMTAGMAAAAPSDDIISVGELQSYLETNTSLPGYLKTVTRGATIETIPLDVLAVTGDASPDSSLIMFEATGPKIDKYGGIVSGMSGSPVYVEIAGEPKLVGALSYGDIFTLGGTGLATPIEAMMDVEANYAPRVEPLSNPEFVNGGWVDRVIVSSEPERYAPLADDGALIARPLSTISIGGIDPRSRVYKALANAFEKDGFDVLPLTTKLGGTAMVGGVPFSTEMTGGAGIAALAARGDMWVGGIGTVTYAADGKVLAFGHPAYWDGETSQYMTNAWIDGIWPNSIQPYKLGRPGQLRGEIQQDRNAGIMGVMDAAVDEVPITSRAVDVSTGREASAVVYVPSRQLNDARIAWPDLAVYAGYAGPSRLYDQWSNPGSALTTTTIVVGDGTNTHTVCMTNIVDDSYDVPSAVINDLWTAVDSLTEVFYYGVETLDIQSIDVQAEIRPQRLQAEIADVKLKKGLKVGPNPVEVSFLRYGQTETATVDATITIPPGTPLSGTLTVASNAYSYWDDYYFEEFEESADDAPVTRPTIADIVKGLNEQDGNGAFSIVYEPAADPMSEEMTPSEYDPVETVVKTDWYVVGEAEKTVTSISARPDPSTIAYGGTTWIWGDILGPEDSSPLVIEIYGTPSGESTETLLATTTAIGGEWGFGYEAPIGGLKKNTSIRVRFAGNNELTACEATTFVRVAARTTIKSSARTVRRGSYVTLTATVLPSTTGGSKVAFQYFDPATRKWRTIATKTLTAGATAATATHRWKPPVGTRKIRAQFLGGITNVASYSSSTYVTAK